MSSPDDSLRPHPTVKRRDRPRPVRLAMRVAYDGGGFRGFQRQPGQRTVEGELMRVFDAAGLGTGLTFASRTDAGVHAEGQVVAARAPAGTTLEALAGVLRGELPPDVRLVDLRPAPARFHPRWSSTGKEYRFTLSHEDGPLRWGVGPLDLSRLEAACGVLSACPSLDGFTAAGAPDKPAPALDRLTIDRSGDDTVLTFIGPAFRRYAIRHMVGSLVACARGEVAPEVLQEIAANRPPYSGPRAPGDGLVLVKVRYPVEVDPFV
jgi:tRNA pseudouridine38-40 synthase